MLTFQLASSHSVTSINSTRSLLFSQAFPWFSPSQSSSPPKNIFPLWATPKKNPPVCSGFFKPKTPSPQAHPSCKPLPLGIVLKLLPASPIHRSIGKKLPWALTTKGVYNLHFIFYFANKSNFIFFFCNYIQLNLYIMIFLFFLF